MTIKLTRHEVETILESSIKGTSEETEFRFMNHFKDGSGEQVVDWDFVEFEGNIGDILGGGEEG